MAISSQPTRSEEPHNLPSYLREDAPFASLARAYFDALLRGERHLASRMILDAAEARTSVKDIYLHVFQPVQYEIGRLWQLNVIRVAQEHYCTAATQLIMSQLYPYIFASEKNGRTLVATCVAGDLHEIGVRMVADFFEMEGWSTYYLGGNTPHESVVATIIDQQAHVLAISVTISSHMEAVRELIREVRGNPGCTRVRILVGGYPFSLDPDLWREVGADGSAADADSAIALADEMVKEGAP